MASAHEQAIPEVDRRLVRTAEWEETIDYLQSMFHVAHSMGRSRRVLCCVQMGGRGSVPKWTVRKRTSVFTCIFTA